MCPFRPRKTRTKTRGHNYLHISEEKLLDDWRGWERRPYVRSLILLVRVTADARIANAMVVGGGGLMVRRRIEIFVGKKFAVDVIVVIAHLM